MRKTSTTARMASAAATASLLLLVAACARVPAPPENPGSTGSVPDTAGPSAAATASATVIANPRRGTLAAKPLPVAQRDSATGRSWVIFYSPHPDDESIGMAQAIRRCVQSGYNVQLVCLTDGVTSRAFETYYRQNPRLWRDLDHNGVKGDRGDFGMERRLEFTRAAADLGVPKDRLTFLGVTINHRRGRDFMSSDRIRQVMMEMERLHPGALHVTVMKYTDGNPSGPGDYMAQAEHTAACDALLYLAHTEHLRAEFYKVYVYDLPAAQRWAPVIENGAAQHATKRLAILDGYDDADRPGHLGIGWHSVPVTIDNVLRDDNEYRTPLADIPW